MKIKAAVAVLTLAATLSPMTRSAERASKQENIGVGSGLVIGALAAGPFGAVAGAATGAWLGNHYSRMSKQVTAAAQADAHAAALADVEIKVEREHYQHLVAGLNRLESDVPFKTNEAVLSVNATAHLRSLGAVLAGLPQTKVRVTGFADPRGTAAENVALSKRRADAVVAVLSEAGVRSDQMVVDARGAGDVAPESVTLDDFALERRASVRLEAASDSTMSAQR